MHPHDDREGKDSAHPAAEPEARADSRNLLQVLRRVLFEEAPLAGAQANLAPSSATTTATPASAIAHTEQEQALQSSSLTTLRDVIAREGGPAFAEFSLQLEALSEAVPDAEVRQRAALSVLARKGFSLDQLLHELRLALAALSEQERLFLDKLEQRRAELTKLTAQAEIEHERACDEAKREIARLEQALELQHELMTRATSARDEQRREQLAASELLELKQRAFDAAHRKLVREYETQCQRLAREPSEKQ